MGETPRLVIKSFVLRAGWSVVHGKRSDRPCLDRNQ
jgi:uncharacterized protein YbdZ (MbtH family)